MFHSTLFESRLLESCLASVPSAEHLSQPSVQPSSTSALRCHVHQALGSSRLHFYICSGIAARLRLFE